MERQSGEKGLSKELFSFTISLVLPDEAAASEGEFHGETCQGEEGEGIRRLDPFLIQ